VRVGGELGDWFRTTVGTRQGDPISPTTFISYLERVMDTIKENGTGITVHGNKITNPKFADDSDLLEENRDELKENLKWLNEAGEASRLKIHIQKTMAFEMKCYRRILHIHWQQKITNVEIRQRLDINTNVMQLIMERKLKLFGHISRMGDIRIVKNVVFGIIDGLVGRCGVVGCTLAFD